MNRIDIQNSSYADCPIRMILSRISDKWSILTLFTLTQAPVMRFNELQKTIPDISQKMLTVTLRTLEEDGLVKRKIYAQVPPKVEYSLTDRAMSLLPHINSLISWAQENMNDDYRYHYSYLLKVMKQYIREYNGQMAYFDGQSTFELLEGAPFINLDISQLEEKFARPLAQQILLTWIWEKFVKKNSEDRSRATKKRVIVDEAWMLLPYPEAVDFLNTMARRARKRNVSLAVVSQRFQDFYEKPEAQAVLTSSDTKLFLAQDKSEIQYLKEVFKLSEGEAGFLVTCGKGEGLLKVGSESAILQITPTQKEFEFVETNLNKLVKNRANRIDY